MTTTVEEPKTGSSGSPPPRRGPIGTALAFLRNTWRGLTAMRTALILLFLLALGAMPGALLPQHSLNEPLVQQYIAQHGWWGRLLDRLQFFNVYSSVWFSAVYVLLFISLVGCLLPRTVEYARQATAKPVLTPRNLSRLPHHTGTTADPSTVDPEVALAAVRERLRGWRTVLRAEPNGAASLSAERGYLRETGNLLFHFAMLGLIVAFALGKMFSYSGQVIVLANGSPQAQFCNSGVLDYDSFTPGLEVDGTQLDPFCVKVDDFHATYLSTGQPDSYLSHIQYQSGNDLDTNTWVPYDLKENAPLRTAGDRIYLLGHGYAPQFTVRYPSGQVRTGVVQWKPDDGNTYLSEGATKFDPPDGDQADLHTKQLAITGLFAPTAIFQNGVMSSIYPALNNPAVQVFVYQGDLGSDAGTSQSIFTIDQGQVADGKLKQVAKGTLRVGDSLKLPDGTTVRFDRVQQWVNLMVAHDPTQDYVLLFAILLLLGLATSLTIKRRRLWVRITPPAGGAPEGRTVIEVGGLARTDQAGYGEEFTKLSAKLLDAARDSQPERGAGRGDGGKDT